MESSIPSAQFQEQGRPLRGHLSTVKGQPLVNSLHPAEKICPGGLGTSLPPKILPTAPKHPTPSSVDGDALALSRAHRVKPSQISLEDGEANIARKDIINIFTDGSKTENGVGAAFCVLTNDIWASQ
ncbi:hypothetical protein AVEN_259535-1 [Araneus ventricosus]|uniref:RNase H type-1 domain-containing protein n=1 Tax=Araneus ventricosus TaxID=182803 RepID=A0A4Y2NYT0_ARAVE|nr:hypothetical protein AVEN_259535-1 [Araneus ventricosus]